MFRRVGGGHIQKKKRCIGLCTQTPCNRRRGRRRRRRRRRCDTLATRPTPWCLHSPAPASASSHCLSPVLAFSWTAGGGISCPQQHLYTMPTVCRHNIQHVEHCTRVGDTVNGVQKVRTHTSTRVQSVDPVSRACTTCMSVHMLRTPIEARGWRGREDLTQCKGSTQPCPQFCHSPSPFQRGHSSPPASLLTAASPCALRCHCRQHPHQAPHPLYCRDDAPTTTQGLVP